MIMEIQQTNQSYEYQTDITSTLEIDTDMSIADDTSGASFTIVRDDGAMVVIPDHKVVRKFLTLTYRAMIKEKRRTRYENFSAPLFKLHSVSGKAALLSYQGFWKSLATHLTQKGYVVEVRDVRRRVLDYPNFAAALQNLRSFQKPWIINALKCGDSGLLGAPTRFGKTYGMESIIRAFPKARTVVTAPGVDLCRQLLEHFRAVFPNREVKGVFTGSSNRNQSDDITVCSVDSLDKMDTDATELLIVDEPHAVVSDGRLPKITNFVRARKYGFGATLKGRFDQKDRLIEGIIGPVISNVTYKEAVDMGAIAPLKLIFIKIGFSKDTVPGNNLDRDEIYKRLLTQSSKAAAIVKTLIEEVIPLDWQTMAFIKDEKQAEFFMEKSMPPAGTIAMAKRMNKAQRIEITNGIVNNEIVRILASNIYVQGLTFPDLRVVINLAGGGANTTAIQKPGRLLQTRPGKNYGVMFDFMFECKDSHLEARANPPYRCIIGDCWARHAAYKEIGYDIEFVESIEEAKKIVNSSYSE
jgi:superfamily II DNA or RNA helicase